MIQPVDLDRPVFGELEFEHTADNVALRSRVIGQDDGRPGGCYGGERTVEIRSEAGRADSAERPCVGSCKPANEEAGERKSPLHLRLLSVAYQWPLSNA